MLNTLLSRFLLLIMMSTLVACSAQSPLSKKPFRNPKNVYMNSPEKNEELKFPPDLRQADISHDFDVKPVAKPHAPVSLLPPGSLASRWNRDDVGIHPESKLVLSSKGIHIQPQGHDRLVMSIDESKDKVWEALEPALLRQEFKILSANAEEGRYLVEEDHGGRFQVLLKEQGDKKTAIHIASFQGTEVSAKLEQRLYNQISDGLKGKSSIPMVARVLKGIQETVVS